MALDPVTLLVLTTAMAAASALYLVMEWSSVRERSLLLWSTGFAIIAVGSTLALLRSRGHVLFGIWFPNGLLISAHWLFLAGVAGFTRARLSRAWWLLVVVWLAMLLLPAGPWWSKVMLGIQSLLIAGITLRAALLLRPQGGALSVGAAQLHSVLLAHGLFYLAKAGSAFVLDAFVNLASFRGVVIQVSLVEGAMAIMLLAMSMIGTERHRREEHIAQIAARDPLTSLDNRRALYLRAPELLEQTSAASPGALLRFASAYFRARTDQFSLPPDESAKVEFNLGLLTRWIKECDGLMNPPAPPMPAGGAGPMPGGPPMLPPGALPPPAPGNLPPGVVPPPPMVMNAA